MNMLERVQRQFLELPPEKQEEVADFVAYLSSRYRRREEAGLEALARYSGLLSDSSSFNEDPIVLQRKLRDEW